MTRPITVDVYERHAADLTQPLDYVGTLTADSKRSWNDLLYDVGSSSVEVRVDHADAALTLPDRFLRWSINGTPRWWSIVEPTTKRSADPSKRKAGRVQTVAGRGGLAILEEAIVFPEVGFGFVSPDTRHLGWMSKYFNDSTWDFAVELKGVHDPDPTKPWFLAPKGMPDANGKWVGPTAGDTPPVAPGVIYLRGGLTVTAGNGGEYQDCLTADDGFEVYRDAGDPYSQQGAGMWGEIQKPPVHWFDEGDHLYAVKVINFDRPNPSTNVMGFIFSVIQMLGGGVQAGPVVARASSGTRMLAFPADEPGMTPGHMIKVLVEENQAAGAILPVHLDFDETVDSAGVTWPKVYNLAFQTSSTVLDAVRSMMQQGIAYFRIRPDSTTLTLQAFVAKGRNLTSSVSALVNANVGALEHERSKVGPNTLASRTAEGRWRIDEDSAAVTARGRRFAGVQLGGAPSDGSAESQAAKILADESEPQEIVKQLRIEAGGDLPYTDFLNGDRITTTGFDGSPTGLDTTGIHISEDDNAAGTLVYEIDMESP